MNWNINEFSPLKIKIIPSPCWGDPAAPDCDWQMWAVIFESSSSLDQSPWLIRPVPFSSCPRIHYTVDQLSWKRHECDNTTSANPLTHTHSFLSFADCGFAEQKYSEGHSELLWWLGLQKHHGLCAEEGTLVLLSVSICLLEKCPHPNYARKWQCTSAQVLSKLKGGLCRAVSLWTCSHIDHAATHSPQLTDHAWECVICLLTDASRRLSAFRWDVLNVVPGCVIFVLQVILFFVADVRFSHVSQTYPFTATAF